MSGQHKAVVLPQKGGPLAIEGRSTPHPGANEYLVQVRAVAMNPIDYYQRDLGIPPISQYPTVLGGDVAGVIAEVGSGVEHPLKKGTRVIAGASAFWQNNDPDYGAFQQYVLVSSGIVTTLPDEYTFEQGAVIPLAAITALTAYFTVGISIDTKHSAQDKQAYLVWGAASSVGTYAVQIAKAMGYTVYATASSKNHEYIKSLGAHAVFDYNDNDVVDQIIMAVKNDGVKLADAHMVVTGGLQPTLDVLKATKGSAQARVAHAPMLPADHPTLENTMIAFNFPPMDPGERAAFYKKCVHGWLAGALEAGSVVSSPPVELEGKGLESIDKALDAMKAGVSCRKIVVTI
ncbi:hypothetical protein LTR62_007859 [Meristemomyces frigidus]|uniref:Enoyl reductase (ER) domain-containing protein n=1 Tax=Meristemomyces frigidus TaxID=1508187 RepID=A0AAN7YM36_9PEZI|nr:hypothetical protein LTR62_007859 [Meristemomyces frigidus]